MEVGYSRLVTSVRQHALTNEYRDGVGAHWTFLSDPGRKGSEDLESREYTYPSTIDDPPCYRPRTCLV